MHRRSIYILVILVISSMFLIAGDPPPEQMATPANPQIKLEVEAAFNRRVQDSAGVYAAAEGFTPEVDSIFISPDGQTAVIWVALRTPSGRILGTEPGLALATLTDAGWQVLFPDETGYSAMKTALPETMLPAEQQGSPVDQPAQVNGTVSALSGYYLPWVAGRTHWLEGSIIHYMPGPSPWGYPSCATPSDCYYAYDFTDNGHFPLVASKDAIFKDSRDSCADGDESCTNYVLLYNQGDGAYQIYLHLAHGTVPDNLKVNDTVQRGQYIGDTDDTGYSTSDHVHFMVVQNPWYGSGGYPWGTSIDIRFADVPINNGIPRTCYEIVKFGVVNGATQCTGSLSNPLAVELNMYTSGNTGANPPSGTVERPAPGVTVAPGSNPLMDATAYATDDVSVRAVRMMAKINGQWVEIGPVVTQAYLIEPNKYDWDVNLCEVGPLNGTYEMALRVWDYEGNVTGPLDPRLVNVDQACPGSVIYLPWIQR